MQYTVLRLATLVGMHYMHKHNVFALFNFIVVHDPLHGTSFEGIVNDHNINSEDKQTIGMHSHKCVVQVTSVSQNLCQ